MARYTRLGNSPTPEQIRQAINELQGTAENPAVYPVYAIFKLSADQTGAATTNLVKFVTAVAKTGEVHANPSGVITLQPGWYKLTASIASSHSTGNSIDVAWYYDPSGANVEITRGLRGFQQNSDSSNTTNGGGSGDAVAFVHAAKIVQVGARIITAGGTSTIDAGYSRAVVEEVNPWEES